MAPELSLGVTLAVLGAGLLHASWNALLKGSAGGEPMFDTAGVVSASALWSLLALPFVPIPAPSVWWFIAASSVIHFGYYITLAQAYRSGDLSFAYPLMRGTAPLIVAVLGIVVLGERPTVQVAIGILLICAGIVSIAFVRRERHPPAAARWAFANAALIACYTLVDGAGARASGNALGYVSWLLFLEGWPFLLWIYWRNGRRAVSYVRTQWRRHLVGGLFSLAAYAIVLWAMTRAPVAAVAALRETSVLFAALFGSIWLKEGFGPMRLAGAASVVAGIAALKL
ncbi:MAG TPA: EamA family transporter [Casimicrobiaceae bacterium]|nr:EamA family transporter [Casimicrobiaceae bacterium]